LSGGEKLSNLWPYECCVRNARRWRSEMETRLCNLYVQVIPVAKWPVSRVI